MTIFLASHDLMILRSSLNACCSSIKEGSCLTVPNRLFTTYRGQAGVA